MNVNVLLAPAVIVPMTHGNDGQLPVKDTKARRPAGVYESSSLTVDASDGPLFVTTMVYVMLLPTVAVAGPVFVTETSAF